MDEVIPALQDLEATVETDRLVAVGFFAYEAAPAFDPALSVRADGAFPLLWFGLFDPPQQVSQLPAPAAGPDCGWAWEPTVTPGEYRRAFDAVMERIRAGDTYQVNYTYRLRHGAAGDPWDLFLRLAQAQDPPYGAFLDTGDWVVCSASPELFFRLDGERIASRPMKGTAPRGRWSADDRRRARNLRRSPKERAENVMIVDMVRNDLGRIACTGSVTVPELFALEAYPTVWQMVSTVAARTRAPLADILAALFPPASITGAPKARTMQIIAGLETTPRRIYTGAVGFIAPGRTAQFNVAIRTALIHRPTGTAEYGVGGGLVWDSRAAAELEETRVKARVLRGRPRPEFELLETLRWTPAAGGYLLDLHLRRLAGSAAYFGFALDPAAVRAAMRCATAGLPPAPHRIRLLVARSGAVRIEAAPLLRTPHTVLRLALAPEPVDPADPFLYHKTTRRDVYEAALRACPGAPDALLHNPRGELTETTIANLVVKLRSALYTPPLACGLLPGTLRQHLLRCGRVRERVVRIEELAACETIWRVNSVRGMERIAVGGGATHPELWPVIRR